MARSSSKVSTGVLSVPVAMPKLGAGPTPPLDALQAVPQRPPCLSFRLLWGAAANQSAFAICIKISRPPLERALSRRQPRPPQLLKTPAIIASTPNIHPPLPQFSTISRTPPLDAHIDHSTVRQRDQHPVPGRVGLTIELPHHRAQAAHPPFDQAEQAIDRLPSYISPSPLGLVVLDNTLDSSYTPPQPPP